MRNVPRRHGASLAGLIKSHARAYAVPVCLQELKKKDTIIVKQQKAQHESDIAAREIIEIIIIINVSVYIKVTHSSTVSN